MKYNKIAFIGMMGSGKSTISKIIANHLNFKHIEMDEIFEIQEKISINTFFKKYGEENFREIETKILKENIKKTNTILSTGGGIILKKENRELLFKNDVLTIYLEANFETIHNRIKQDKTRPLLQVDNSKKEIKDILKTRKDFYKLANITINTDNKTIEEITEEILKWIK